MNLFKLMLKTKISTEKEGFNMKKFILPVVIIGVIVLKIYGFKKYLAKNNNMSNAEL